MKRYTTKELNEIFEKHVLWVETRGDVGEQADLQGVDLSGVDLTLIDLSTMRNVEGANLDGAMIYGHYLKKA